MVSLFGVTALVLTSTVQSSSTTRDRRALEAEFASALAAETPATPEAAASTASSRPTLRLIDVALDLLAVGGTSSAFEPELRQLEGGGHDPKNRGFTLQNVELTLSGIVDPYVRGDANI